MQRQYQLEEHVEILIARVLSTLEIFRQFAPYDLQDFAQHIAPYAVWILLNRQGYKNAEMKKERWLHNYNNTNYILPNVYVDPTYYGFYMQAKKSLPRAAHTDWANIACIAQGEIQAHLRTYSKLYMDFYSELPVQDSDA
uniref:Class I SAM-dependent methyltransferase n=1 Tax=Steinernema glaseri TaxID=37863 RepID=A0A1I8AR10_9BILA